MSNNVPKLRFNGFEDEWEEKKMSSICLINQGLQIAISERFTEFKEGRYFYITNEFLRSDSDKKYYIENPSENVKCDRDDILMTRTGNTGKVVTNVSGAFHNNFFKINYNKLEVNKEFLCDFLKSDKTQKNILRLAGTSTIPDLNHNDFYNIKINMPSLKEQEKISNFLTNVHKIIEKQEEKVSNLESYKKGMMQKIFSQEIRFKDENGKEYPEWDNDRLGNICSIIMGQSPNSEFYNEEFIGLPLIQGNADMRNRKTLPRIYTSSITKTCEVGDIVMSVRAPAGTIARSEHEACIGRGVCAIRTQERNEFIYQLLLMQEDKWNKFSQGSTFDSINSSDINNLEVNLPCLEEQTKIANFLSKIDSIIEKEKEKLAELRLWKKGLLQQMFV